MLTCKNMFWVVVIYILGGEIIHLDKMEVYKKGEK